VRDVQEVERAVLDVLELADALPNHRRRGEEVWPMRASVLALHERLDEAQLPHAISGTIALDFWIADPRATGDIDVHVPLGNAEQILDCLRPDGWAQGSSGSISLWIGGIPIDVWHDDHPFLKLAVDRAALLPFAGTLLPVLRPKDLGTLKSLIGRERDWLDVSIMSRLGVVDAQELAEQLRDLLGADDERVARAAALPTEPEPPVPPRILDRR
jgi:hypothetical protein